MMKDETMTMLILRVLIRALGMLFLEHRKRTSLEGTGSATQDENNVHGMTKKQLMIVQKSSQSIWSRLIILNKLKIDVSMEGLVTAHIKKIIIKTVFMFDHMHLSLS